MGQEMMIVQGMSHDLGGGLTVRRLLPYRKKRMVGPFIFLDHLGPLEVPANQNTDVRPHPHIGLSTLTYLFEGRIVHRDSLGTTQIIEPGGVNWMTAGRAIAHSERAHPDDKSKPHRLHGLQFWVALPDGAEEVEPMFQHVEASKIPRFDPLRGTIDAGKVEVVVVAGAVGELKSPVKASSPLIFLNVNAKSAASFKIPFGGLFESAIYVLAGSVEVDGQKIGAGSIAILPVGDHLSVLPDEETQFIVIGGEGFTTERYIWWNLVSSSKEKIELAKKAWRDQTFPSVPGETERIPLPDIVGP